MEFLRQRYQEECRSLLVCKTNLMATYNSLSKEILQNEIEWMNLIALIPSKRQEPKPPANVLIDPTQEPQVPLNLMPLATKPVGSDEEFDSD